MFYHFVRQSDVRFRIFKYFNFSNSNISISCFLYFKLNARYLIILSFVYQRFNPCASIYPSSFHPPAHLLIDSISLWHTKLYYWNISLLVSTLLYPRVPNRPWDRPLGDVWSSIPDFPIAAVKCQSWIISRHTYKIIILLFNRIMKLII